MDGEDPSTKRPLKVRQQMHSREGRGNTLHQGGACEGMHNVSQTPNSTSANPLCKSWPCGLDWVGVGLEMGVTHYNNGKIVKYWLHKIPRHLKGAFHLGNSTKEPKSLQDYFQKANKTSLRDGTIISWVCVSLFSVVRKKVPGLGYEGSVPL